MRELDWSMLREIAHQKVIREMGNNEHESWYVHFYWCTAGHHKVRHEDVKTKLLMCPIHHKFLRSASPHKYMEKRRNGK